MKNPFTIHYHHHAANIFGRALGRWVRNRFARRLQTSQWQPHQQPVKPLKLSCEIVTLAGKGSFPEVVVMLDSFYANVGEPKTCRVISDGTLDSNDAQILARIHPQISVLTLDQFLATPVPPSLQSRLHQHPMMKKLGVMIGTSRLENGFYIDSDFLFFPAAREFDWSALLSGPSPRYMQDTGVSLDPRLLKGSKLPLESANAGLILFNQPLELEPYANRLDVLGSEPPHHFSEQTLMHIALTEAGALKLDPARFILAFDDQFSFRDKHAFRENVLCRHYTTPIRHKFWIQTLFY